ncbi:hypothetical protein [Mesobacillus harenae]|uniref:hypothetical protein n=1 Tax=Mesobacillus harenae TaxID=2213203 RepID=UPI00157FC917|nr:hypothetical protein [Mesobacillus harenae]
MEFLLMFSLHFFMMGSLVLLLSGIITFLWPRLNFLIIISIFGLTGFLYALYFNVMELALFAVFFNMLLSLIAVGLVKLGFYFKGVADSRLAMKKGLE